MKSARLDAVIFIFRMQVGRGRNVEPVILVRVVKGDEVASEEGAGRRRLALIDHCEKSNRPRKAERGRTNATV